MRPLHELTDVDDPAWPHLARAVEAGPAAVRLLPPEAERSRACLYRLQVTVRSLLGAMALETGGLLIDDGWLRVYGGGTAGFPGLADVNGLVAGPDQGPPPRLVVAHDVLGGTFALGGPGDGGDAWPGGPGEMAYFAPDSLEWEALGTGYSGWLLWLLEQDPLAEFYRDLRWPGWREETAGLGPAQGIAVYPFLWSAEAQADLAATTRSPVPLRELTDLGRESCAPLGLPDPGPLGAP
ncbi:uncharacterized protein DUF2625 [Nocardiopsis sp. Huas11]|uniref:DUF2625 family protein n=1 Tax=Nocardiopsis sp. Huas11 TaxID=2183912 RepID=UPI000EADFD51|nr:DUF2625 family protein [Nocardiopsis sp. Huas11]RKS10096.1 uncharacterized protein DUF2625 [Nocardiopsis sp. Huas11]